MYSEGSSIVILEKAKQASLTEWDGTPEWRLMLYSLLLLLTLVWGGSKKKLKAYVFHAVLKL